MPNHAKKHRKNANHDMWKARICGDLKSNKLIRVALPRLVTVERFISADSKVISENPWRRIEAEAIFELKLEPVAVARIEQQPAGEHRVPTASRLCHRQALAADPPIEVLYRVIRRY